MYIIYIYIAANISFHLERQCFECNRDSRDKMWPSNYLQSFIFIQMDPI